MKLIPFSAFTRAQSDTCPVFGTDQSSSLSRSTEARIFLNFESPSQCRGNVTSYRYCFYGSTIPDGDSDGPSLSPGDNDGDSDGDSDGDNTDNSGNSRRKRSSDDKYGARLMIYRRSTPNSAAYTPVPGSIRTLSLMRNEVGGFECRDEIIPRGFEIQENDVVGACVMDTESVNPESVNPLYLIGDTDNNSANYSLYQMNRSGFDDCTDIQIGYVDTGRSDFRRRRRSVLYLHANIGES